jgi:hypothetical protein
VRLHTASHQHLMEMEVKHREPQSTKVTIKFFAPMYRQFERQLHDVLLLKDAYIDHMIERELPNLEQDIKGRRNSVAARRHIAGALKRMGGESAGQLMPISIKIRKSTARHLKQVVDRHNLCRDAFVNRLVANLRGTDAWLRVLHLSPRVDQIRHQAGVQDMPTSPLKAIEESLSDPLYYLRSEAEGVLGTGLYTIGVPEWLHGFACVLPDDEVPGTPEYRDATFLFDDDRVPDKPEATRGNRSGARK